MRPATYRKQLDAAIDNGICVTQEPTEAGDIAINGSLSDNDVATMDTQRRVSITNEESTVDMTGVTFTISGFDGSGNAISEDIAGPPAGGQVATELDFLIVDTVFVDGPTGGDIRVGSHESGSTPPIRIDQFADPVAVSLALEFHDEDSDANASVQYCFDEGTSTRVGPFHWFDHGDLHLRTENTTGALINPVTAIRLLVNSGNSTAVLHVVQAASH